MEDLTQSTAHNLMVFMVDDTDHITGKTGLTLTMTASKNGAAFGSISPTVTERGDGWYNMALTTSHTDTLGDLAFHIVASDADPLDFKVKVVASAAEKTFGVLRNVAYEGLPFLVTDATHQPKTGLVDADFTLKQVLIDGTPATLSGTITELANGWYEIDLTDAETDGDNLAFSLDATACDPCRFSVLTTS